MFGVIASYHTGSTLIWKKTLKSRRVCWTINYTIPRIETSSRHVCHVIPCDVALIVVGTSNFMGNDFYMLYNNFSPNTLKLLITCMFRWKWHNFNPYYTIVYVNTSQKWSINRWKRNYSPIQGKRSGSNGYSYIFGKKILREKKKMVYVFWALYPICLTYIASYGFKDE